MPPQFYDWVGRPISRYRFDLMTRIVKVETYVRAEGGIWKGRHKGPFRDMITGRFITREHYFGVREAIAFGNRIRGIKRVNPDWTMSYIIERYQDMELHWKDWTDEQREAWRREISP